VPSNGTYSFDYRVASTVGGTIELRLIDNPTAPESIHTVTVPNTGGWQTWKSVTASGKLTAGTHTLRVYVKKAEFNINWFKVSLVTGVNDLSGTTKMEIFPNPAQDQLTLKAQGINGNYQVRLINAQGVTVKQFNQSFNSGTNGQIDISDLPDGFYILSLENQANKFHFNLIKRE
jgi:hypothetical protein